MGGAGGCPFEDKSLPFWDRLWGTIRLTITNPKEFFDSLPDGEIGLPLLYGLIVGTVGVVLGQLWNLVFSAPMSAIMGAPPEEAAVQGFFSVVTIVLSPLFVVIGLFIWSGIYHLMLLLLGDASRGFGITFRVVCYASTTQLFNIVPFCGGLIAGIWNMVLSMMGATIAHRTDAWRAILAYFLPVIICCCIPLVILFMMGGFAALMQGGAGTGP
jgi:hypothetical protein